MFFILVIVLVALIVLATGGSLANLKNCRFKFPWLVIIAACLKIISISNILVFSDYYASYFRIASLILVILFLVFNFSLRGMPLIALGFACNAAVIMLNGGNMPVAAEYAELVATGADLQKLLAGLPVDSFILTSAGTKLTFLGDIFKMPDWVPVSKLFSIGDVFATIGGIVFVVYYLKFSNNKKYK